MSTRLLDQLADYGAYHDEVQGNVDVTEGMESIRRSELAPAETIQRSRRSISTGLLTAAAASLAVLVLVGGAVLLLRRSVDRPDGSGTFEEQGPATQATIAEATSSPPTTVSSPATTVPAEVGFAPRLEGSGVAVDFSVTPRDVEIAGQSFVLMVAEWSIDWEAVAWDWGDDEVRQRIAASSGVPGGNYAFRPPDTLIFVDDVQNSWRDPFERFTFSFSGTAEDFEIDVSKESSGEHLASVTGSLPGLNEDQILFRIASAKTGVWEPSRAGWFFDAADGVLTSLDPPWEPYWGEGYFEPDPFFDVGGFVLVVLERFEGPQNVWRTTDGYFWEDLGEPAWPDLASSPQGPFAHEGRLYEHGWTRDAQGYLLDLEFWVSSDGVEWTELTRAEYEAATGLSVDTANSDELPPPPDPWFPEDLDRAAIETHLDELAQNAIVISEDPLILQLLPGPEPLFDPSRLGDEVPFVPLSPGDQRAEWAVELLGEILGDPIPKPDGPVLFVGHIAESSMALPYTDMGRYAGFEMFWATYCSFECLGVEGLQAAGELSGDIWIADNGEDVLVAVPVDAAVVVLRYNADTALWQRPTGGWAVFPSNVDGDETFWVDAYDADGNLIATTERR